MLEDLALLEEEAREANGLDLGTDVVGMVVVLVTAEALSL